jgi:hydrogenase maturation protease
MTLAVGSMKIRDVVEQIADAVLYEGYILYPYRPTAVKNQQRWNFGVLSPRTYAESQNGTEGASMQTQCLISSNTQPVIDVKIRFLHLIERQIYKSVGPCALSDCNHLAIDATAEHFEPVSFLPCNGRVLKTWQEAIEREVVVENVYANEKPQIARFSYPAQNSHELVFDNETGRLCGLLMRRQHLVNGVIEIAASELDTKLHRLDIRVHNETTLESASTVTRDVALLSSFISTHSIMRVQNGEFISLLDPPEFAREAAAACENVGTYPVLAGEDGSRHCILSSPIILYDHPQIAPESAGDLYDGTEIDEILSLRIMTLTDEEKREIRDADDRARAILERTENMPAEQFLKMHGVMKRT